MEEPAPPYLTYPFTEEDAAQFVELALQDRPGKNKHVIAFKDQKAEFLQAYERIQSLVDKQLLLDDFKTRHKKLKSGDFSGYHIANNQIERLWNIDIAFFIQVMNFLRAGLEPPVALWIWQTLNFETATRPDYCNILIDSYLFAESKYQFALFLETFNPADYQPGPATSTQRNEQPGPVKDKERSADTQRKARQAVTLYENKIEEIVKRNTGKLNPLSDKQVVAQALTAYVQNAVSNNLAFTEKGLQRYLSDIGKKATAKKYGGQLVRQLRERK
jgi:hypothetical protein